VRGEFEPGKGIGYLADGTKIVSHASIYATGITYRRLNLPNEDRLLGAGVYYGAGASEAELCGSEQVVVVGRGNSAAQGALHLARYASNVIMVLREDRLTENMSKYLAERIEREPRIEVLLHTEVAALHGERVLHAVTLRNNRTGEERTVETSWLFLCRRPAAYAVGGGGRRATRRGGAIWSPVRISSGTASGRRTGR
jgi:thioredoxin reductase (NADPH)